MYQIYAQKIAEFAEWTPGRYSQHDLNGLVLAMDFGEKWVAAGGTFKEPLKLEHPYSLQAHAQISFFGVITSNKGAHHFTYPFYIHRRFLENLENWHEWKTLESYLRSMDFLPSLLFKNAPTPDGYYLADLRVLFIGADFDWEG